MRRYQSRSRARRRSIDVLLSEAAPRLAYLARGVAERSVRSGLARA
jgi:hypothetical protein